MVIFTDLSEVLIHGIYGMEQIVAKRYGGLISREFWLRHDETNDRLLEVFRGKLKEDDYWTEFLDKDDLHMSLNGVKNVLTENIHRVIPGTLDVYKSIKSHPRYIDSAECIDGRPNIYITSDHIEERIGQIKLVHPDIFKTVDGEYWSCRLGCIKGDPDFFPTVLKRVGVNPEEVVFIDDIKHNVDSAERCGIHGIVFEDANQLKSDLEKLGFTFV